VIFLLPLSAPAEKQQPQDENAFISHVNRKWIGGFEGMRERRMIRALVVYSKTHFFIDKGTKRGIAHDMLMAFEKDLNRALKTTKKNYINIVFVPVNHDEIIPALLDGRGDIAAANLTITPEREAHVDFSAPTVTNVSEVVVTGRGAPEVKTLEDLSGRQVFVRPTSSYHEHLTALNRQFKDKGLEPVEIVSTPAQLEEEDLLEMTNAGLIPMTVVDSHLAQFWSGFFDNMTVHNDVMVNSGGAIAVAFRKGSPKLKALIDDFLKRNGAETVTGNTIFRRYLKDTRWVANAGAESEMKKFRQAVELFKKYGDQYQFDHLLLAAQGYQESRLNQSARSPVGAVGIMQVMPETGRELGVGDIMLLEPNIHAGTKYMRKIMDQYFSDAVFDDLNRNLFAFASYNAGPNRIAKLRQTAGKQGLDPNVWFGNVERVVADRVGQEPVRYVSNIFKYYVAYKLAAEQRAERKMVRENVRQELKTSGPEKKPPGFFKKIFDKVF
jgi:membrane-bound lytic murein transglycosylase MltF